MSKLGRGPVDKGVRTRMEGKRWVEHRGLASGLRVGDRLPNNGYGVIEKITGPKSHREGAKSLLRIHTANNLFVWHRHRFTVWEREEYPDG